MIGVLPPRVLDELWDAIERAAGDPPHVDSARAHGIRFDRSTCPPDDRLTDVLATIEGEVTE